MQLLRIWGLLKTHLFLTIFYSLFGAGERGAVISKISFNTVFDILPSAVLGCATEDNLRTLV